MTGIREGSFLVNNFSEKTVSVEYGVVAESTENFECLVRELRRVYEGRKLKVNIQKKISLWYSESMRLHPTGKLR